MGLNARYLADKSALARFPVSTVAQRLRPLLEEGQLATCAIIDLEVLYSAQSAVSYEEILTERRSLAQAPITPEVLESAFALQRALAHKGQHRLPIPDLIISATARIAGLIVLHYDADFERLAAVGGAEHEWVVPRGSLR